MSNYRAVYYRQPDGVEPVREFIAALGAVPAAAVARQIERLNLLNDATPHLPFPHSSQIDGELRELRCHYGRDLYRVLYRRSDRLIVLLHILAKRSRAVPQGDIRVANERFDDFRSRMDARPRKPPRPAGRDAP